MNIFVILFATGLAGQEFEFLPNGDGPARYRILNFRQTQPGIFQWDTVGYFKDGQLMNVSNGHLKTASGIVTVQLTAYFTYNTKGIQFYSSYI